MASDGAGSSQVVFDPRRPSIARVYDLALGGKDNYQCDREAGQHILERLPEARELARDCRDFVRRSVDWLVGAAGIDQIIDVGSGLPTCGNVHEIARARKAGVRVVYVDNDPMVLAHCRARLDLDGDTEMVEADVRRPRDIFENPRTRRLIDGSRPTAVLMSCVLHHLDDADDPASLVDEIKNRLRPGSYLALANFVHAESEPRAPWVEEAFLSGGLGSGRFREHREQLGYFDGLELVDPGVVFANDWKPDSTSPRRSPVHRLHLVGVGRKPG